MTIFDSQRHALGQRAAQALQKMLANRSLLAFDFDGTLAPIVANPALARPSRSTVRALSVLQRHHHVAIITGRSVDDVRQRLDFQADAIFGSHGAEELGGEGGAVHARALDPLRGMWRSGEWGMKLASLGVTMEDKGASIALHYRLARPRAQAVEALQAFKQIWAPELAVFDGKMVVNFTSKHAPDKADAVALLQRRFNVGQVLFAGDDVNDEPVFERQRPDWLTVKVGDPAITPSKATFHVRTPADFGVFLTACLRWNTAPLRCDQAAVLGGGQ